MLLRQARYFVAVVDAGSFTEAAEKLFISQSAVSQQIKALEEELGVPLLLRAKRTFSLTPAGEYFYRRGKALIEETDAILRETVRIGKGEKQHLHIGYLNNFSGLALSRAVADFVNIYPDVDIKLRSGTHEELYDALENYDIDMAMSDQRRAFSEEYVNVELSEAPVWIEVSAGSCHSKLEAVEVEDLHTLPCILLAKGEQQAEEQSYYQKILGFPGEFLFAGSMEEARLMVVSEQGFLPIEDIGTLPAAGDGIKRIAVLRHGVPLCRRYCIFWKKEQGSALVDKFAEILRKYISS